MPKLAFSILLLVYAAKAHCVEFPDYADDPRNELQVLGPGATEQIFPEATFFDSEESITLKSIPAGEEFEHLYWIRYQGEETYGLRIDAGNEINVKIDRDTRYLAATSRSYDFGEAKIRVPLHAFEELEISGEGAERTFKVTPTGASIGQEIYLDVEGPGVVSFEAKSLVNGYNPFGYWSLSNDTFQPISFSVGAGHSELVLSVNEALLLKNLQIERGYPVSISVDGDGIVTGAPEGKTMDEPIKLMAVATEGWRFIGWEGSFESRLNPLTIAGSGALELIARFYEETELDGLTTGFEELENWDIEQTADGMVVSGDANLRYDEENSILWELEGPGEFRFDFDKINTKAKVFLDGKEYLEIGNDYEDGELHTANVEIENGKHFLEFIHTYTQAGSQEAYLKLSGFEWTPGFLVSVKSLHGGTVLGLEGDSSRLTSGTLVELEAVAEEGFVFTGWKGYLESSESSVEFTVDGPTSLVAVFKKSITGHDIWTETFGDNIWTIEEDTLMPPVILEPLGFATLYGTIQGPVQLSFTDVNYGDYGSLDISFPESVVNGNANSTHKYFVPEGLHLIKITTSADRNGHYTKRILSNISLTYPVSIFVNSGALETTPSLRSVNRENGQIEFLGDLKKGTLLTFSASGADGLAFSGWSGDLEGKSMSDSIVVENQLEAQATFTMSAYQSTDGTLWDLEPVGAASPIDGGLQLLEQHDVAEISTTLEGPGTLNFNPWGLDNVEFFIDNELVYESLRQPAGIVDIPPGTHNVRLALTANPQATPQQHWVAKGLRFLQFNKGFHVFGYSNGGGSVPLDSNKYYYNAGETASLTAEAGPGNLFIGWAPPFENESSSIEMEINDHIAFRPLFVADTEIEEIGLSYEGERPFYIESSYEYPNGHLQYRLDSENPVGSHTVVFSFSDSGILNQFWDYTTVDGSILDIEILLNGEPVQADSNWYYKLIADGPHTLSFSIRDPSAKLYDLRLGLPTIQTEFEVNASAENAEIAVSVDKEFYSIGESITFTAPTTDLNGLPFSGWWTDRNRTHLSADHELTVVVKDDASYWALYAPPSPIQLEGATILTGGNQGEWLENNSETAPGGGVAWRGAFNAKLTIVVTKPSVVRFYSKITSEEVRMDFSINNSSIKRLAGKSDWALQEIYLTEGELFDLSVITTNNSTSPQSWLGGFTIEEGWGPSVLRLSPGEIAYSGDLSSLPQGSAVTAFPSGNDEDRFLGWLDENSNIEASQTKSFNIGDNVILHPIFAAENALPEGIERGKNTNGWTTKTVSVEDSEKTIWTSRHSNKFSDTHTLELKATGPKVLYLEFDMDYRATFEVLLDQFAAETSQSRDYDQRVKMIQIPDGEHTLSITHTNNWPASGSHEELDLEVIDLVPGFLLLRDEELGGSVGLSPERDVYNIGDTVNVVAQPGQGYRFVDWKGTFKGFDRQFSHTLQTHAQPLPIFELETRSVSVFGLDWETKGLILDVDVEKIATDPVEFRTEIVVNPIYDVSESWMKTNVIGPKTLKLEKYTDASRIHLDGVSFDELDLIQLSGEDTRYYAIPSGEHVLSIEPFSSTDLSLGLLDGSLIAADALGGDIIVDPEMIIYPPGTAVELTFVGPFENHRLEWIGLPINATGGLESKQFTVQDHARIDALNWRNVSLHGYGLEHAGDQQWTYDAGQAIYRMKDLRAGERDLLRYAPPEAGWFNYNIVIPWDTSYEGLVMKIGREGSNSATEHSPYNPRGVKNVGPNIPLIFDLKKSIDAWRPNGNGASIRSFSLLLTTEQLYLQWWENYAGADSLWSYSPAADIDKDGFSNYEEFLLNTDPTHPNNSLRIVHSESEEYFNLILTDLPEEMQSYYEFEYSLNFKDWDEADGILGLPYSDTMDTEHMIYELSPDTLINSGVYFRRRYTETIPNLEDLIE